MNLNIRWRALPRSTTVDRHLERRLAFALSRFETRLATVTAELSDQNGPRGGADKRCRLQARGPGLGHVIVEDTSSDLTEAIDRAADRMGRTVARIVERTRILTDRELRKN